MCSSFWLSGNELVLINQVTLRPARLLLGWLTVCGYTVFVLHNQAIQVNSAFHPFVVGKSSTGLVDWS